MTYASLDELFLAICDAIRSKEGSGGLISHQDIPDRIDGLSGLEAAELSGIYLWKKYTGTEEYEVAETEQTNVNLSYYNPANMNDWDTVSYADEIKVVSGEITLVNPVSITLNSTSDRSVLLGKYVYSGNTKLYYRIPEDTSITYVNSTYGTSEYIRASVAMKLAVSTTEVDGGELIGYVVSSDKADYPENGNVGDGYKYVYIGTAESNEGLDTSDATAVADDILKGKTAYANGRKITGTHECAGDTSETVEQATPTIKVSNSGLITATAEQIAGYVKAGTKSATKQLTTQAAKTYTPGTSDQTIASGKYLSGVQTIEGDSNLVASNIKSGVSIFGVAGSYAGENTEGIDTSDATATAADIAKGATAYVNGEKITGTHECEGGIDTSDATATATDMASGKTAYVNGEKITGTLSNIISLPLTNGTPQYNSGNDQGIGVKCTNTTKCILDKNSNVVAYAKASEFGDATAEDVAAGKTFTSAAGLLVTGTREESAGESAEGYVIKTGTVTNENVIETGLSYIKQICLYRKTFTSQGLLCYMYNDELGGIYTYCTNYSSYAKSAGHGQTTDDYRDGGTFTYGMTGTTNKMANGVEYTWIAIGEE